MGFNLTNEFIDQTFQQLVQISGSVLLNGTGSVITDLDFTGSHVESASHAEFADEAYSASNATNAQSSTTASYVAGGNVDGTVTSASFAGTANSSSHAQFSVTSSFALNFNPSATASYADYATSASYAITASHVDGTIESASYALNADSASHAEFADSSGNAEEIFISVQNVQGSTITKGQALHATGVSGENITVITASSDISANMPAIGIAQTNINNNAVGECIVSGRLKNFDTSNLVAGATVYVNSDGGLTATKPTGSDLIQNIGIAAKINATEGEIVVLGSGRSNDLPNITENYVWLGNSNQVPTAVASSSLRVDNATSSSYATQAGNATTATSASHAVQTDNALSSSTATSASHAIRSDIADGIATDARLNVVDITASAATFTSASIGYLQTITGSAKIIGDAFIILNNDTPTERYAGIKVIDSGAADTTASLQFDGQTNDWFYEYGGVDATDHGVAIFGPEYGTKGSPTYPTANTIQKGDGGHHLLDSSIVDNGTNVTTNLPISASGGITGSLNGNADSATTASYATYAENANVDSGSWDGSFTGTASITGSLIVSGGNFDVLGATRNGSSIDSNFKQNLASPGLNNQYDLIAVSTTTIDGFTYANVNNFFADYSSFGPQYKDYFAIEYYDSFGYNYGSEFSVNGVSANISSLLPNGQFAQFKTQNKAPSLIANGRGTVSGSHAIMQAGGTGSQALMYAYNGASIQLQAIGSQGGSTAYIQVDSDSDITLNASDRIIVTGSIVNEINALSIASNTASMDCKVGDMFTLTLVSGSDTHLDASNIQAGQTINLKVLQPSTAADSYGTMTFAPEFKFSGGTAPTITAASGSTDILTFQSYDASSLFGTAVQNLS